MCLATSMASYIPAGYNPNDYTRKVLIVGNVYGGGELGTVDGSTAVNVYEGEVGQMDYVDSNDDGVYESVSHVKYDGVHYGGHVFGGGKGNTSDAANGLVTKNATVNIEGGHVYFNVYGGGEMGSVGQTTTGANGEPVPVAYTGLV